MFGITKLFKDFTSSEKSAGYVLIASTIISLLLANLIIGAHYPEFFHQKIGFEGEFVNLNLSIDHWINDGLMTIFFFMVGLEIEREIYIGELSTFRNASLPVAAAVGGMVVPCIIYLLFNYGTNTQQGYGIPMATDIAFALGVLSLIKRIPYGLKVFLTAFAIIDDLGAIIIIAIFYTDNLNFGYLLAAFAIFGLMIMLNRLRVHRIVPYILPAIIMWYCMMQSGVHATISGVLTAFALPFGTGDEKSLSYKVQKFLHKPVAFVILPLFALANTAIIIPGTWLTDLTTANSLGVIVGLVAGKPVGVLLLSYLAIRAGVSSIPERVNWKHLSGAAALGGIGFTMSIFITLLAFDEPAHINQSKMAILVSSIVASFVGLMILSVKKKREKQNS
jgi:Na+:H+ antiporter, NhaA family